MRILIVNYEFPPLGGGAGNASYHIAKEIVCLGHHVAVVTTAYEGLPAKENVEGIDIVRVPASRREIGASNLFEMMSFVLSTLPRLKRILAEHNPEVSIAFFTLPCGPISVYLKLRFNVPYLTMLRGGDVPGFKGIGIAAGLAHSVLKPLTRFIWSRSVSVVANSNGLKTLASKSWEGPIETIPNGVDTRFFHPSSVPKNRDFVQILFVGRLSKQKGLSEFLTQLTGWTPSFHWQVTVVGDGPEMGRLREMARRMDDLANRIDFRGWMNKEELLQVYQTSDIFILPSLDEGMPNVVLEAMACALPVVATRVPGNEELVVDGVNGFLYDVTDGAAARHALEQIGLDASIRSRFSQASRNLAQRRSWSDVANRLLKLAASSSQRNPV